MLLHISKCFFLLLISVFSHSHLYSINTERGLTTPNVKKDTVEVTNLVVKAEGNLTKNIDSASYYIEKAGKLARRIGEKKAMLDYLSIHIKVLNRQGKYKEALILANESLKLSKEVKRPSSIAVAYNNLGNEYSYLGKLDLAAENYLSALKIAEGDTSLRKLEQKFCNNLASVFIELKDKARARLYAKRSYNLASKGDDSYSVAASLVNLANSEVLNGQLDVGITYLNELIEVSQKLDDITYLLDAYINSGHIATEQKEYDEALNYFKKAEQKLNNQSLPDYELYINWGLGQSYYHLRSLIRAEEHVSKSIEIAEEIAALHELQQLYDLAATINEDLNKHKIALSYRKQFEQLKDSIVNAETRENINKLEIEYQTSQKEKALAEQKLLIAKNEIDLQKKNKYILIFTLISVFSCFIAGFIFLIYKQKQKVNTERLSLLEKEKQVQVLEAMVSGEEKERARLAKELHDGIGGILSATKMHLSILNNENPFPEKAPKFADTMGMLDSAFKEIRSIAHNLAPEILWKHGLTKALFLFCERVSNEQLQVDYYAVGDIPRLQSNYELIIYRIIQELINNIIKHSQASNAYVQLTHHDNFMTITVEDEGIGMEEKESKGIGMSNLRSRIDTLKGDLNISSELGKGTTFYIEFEVIDFLAKEKTELIH